MATQPPTAAACAVCTAPTGDAGVLCRTHTEKLVEDLRAVPQLVDELDVTITRQDRVTTGSGVGRSAERPLAFNEHAAEKRSELWTTLHAWALDVAKLGEDDRDPLADVDTYDIPGAALWLARNRHTLRLHTDAGTAYDEILDAVRGARRATDRPATATRFYAGPCPETLDVASGTPDPGNPTGVSFTPCDGEVWAFIPTDPDRLAVLRCQACDAGWDTTQWLRVGRRMLARIAQLRPAS